MKKKAVMLMLLTSIFMVSLAKSKSNIKNIYNNNVYEKISVNTPLNAYIFRKKI